jgi:Glycosyl transferase family 2
MVPKLVSTPQPAARTNHFLPLLPLKPLPPNPEVSVLITSYNYGRFVGQAIESALGQSYPPKEIIVADDGSEDDSCEIVEGFIQRGAPVKLLRGKHLGMAGGLNAAFQASSREILCLLDADDYFLPGKIEAVVSAFRSQPQAGFAIHRAQMIDPSDRGRGIYPLLSSLPQGNCAEATLRNAGILMGLPPTSNLSLRYRVARSIFPIPASFSGYAEQVIHRMAPLITSICAINKPLSVWRLHGNNDGNSSRVKPERLQRELLYMYDLWLGQRSYLLDQNPEFADRLPGLETNPLYMRDRLRGDPAAKECHAALCALTEPRRSIVDLFWRHSIHLPRPLFQTCIDLLQTQNIWKEWLARMVRWRYS